MDSPEQQPTRLHSQSLEKENACLGPSWTPRPSNRVWKRGGIHDLLTPSLPADAAQMTPCWLA